MAERGPGKVRPARVSAGAAVPDEVRPRLADMARRHGVSPGTLEERFRWMEGYDLIRERFKERPPRERWDYILLILEERLEESSKDAAAP